MHVEDPANSSGGSGGGAYPEWAKSQLLLLLVWNKLQEAYDEGESELRVTIRRGRRRAGVNLGYRNRVEVSDEIPELERGGEAVAVFERLRKEGYVYGDFGAGGPSDMETPVLYGLTATGLTDIGKFPDPDARFAAAIATAHRAIERDPNIPETEKREVLDTTEKMASLANNMGGLAQAFIQGLSQ